MKKEEAKRLVEDTRRTMTTRADFWRWNAEMEQFLLSIALPKPGPIQDARDLLDELEEVLNQNPPDYPEAQLKIAGLTEMLTRLRDGAAGTRTQKDPACA